MRPFVNDDGLGLGSLSFFVVGILYNGRFLVHLAVFAFLSLLNRDGLLIFNWDLLFHLLELVDWEGSRKAGMFCAVVVHELCAAP